MNNPNDATLLGKGSESSVYALDENYVLRCYRSGVDPAYITARHTFYQWLHQQDLPFATAHVVESGQRDGYHYSIEARMPGRDMAQVLPTLRGTARQQAWASFLDAALQLGRVRLPADTPFGELAALNPLRRADWGQFLVARIQQSLQESYDALAQDVPHLDARIAAFEHEALALPSDTPKRLVHGDYFPGNVFLGDDLTITGVGDFGYSTVAGDPCLDWMGALSFIELVDGYQPQDSETLRALLVEQVASDSSDMLERITFYRRYAAFYFSPCYVDDLTTYTWCVATLCERET